MFKSTDITYTARNPTVLASPIRRASRDLGVTARFRRRCETEGSTSGHKKEGHAGETHFELIVEELELW